jgi:hypothetical protein
MVTMEEEEMVERIVTNTKEITKRIGVYSHPVITEGARVVVTMWGRENFAIISMADLRRLEALDEEAGK